MIFSWDDMNRDHIARHAVTPEEAEYVVCNSEPPFPRAIDNDKLVVWGATAAGRQLQVIFVFKEPDEVAYESLTVEDWMDVEAAAETVVIRVIHAMDLTPGMKRGLRRRRR